MSPNQQALAKHLVKHRPKRWECTVCGKDFLDKRRLTVRRMEPKISDRFCKAILFIVFDFRNILISIAGSSALIGANYAAKYFDSVHRFSSTRKISKSIYLNLKGHANGGNSVSDLRQRNIAVKRSEMKIISKQKTIKTQVLFTRISFLRSRSLRKKTGKTFCYRR